MLFYRIFIVPEPKIPDVLGTWMMSLLARILLPTRTYLIWLLSLVLILLPALSQFILLSPLVRLVPLAPSSPLTPLNPLAPLSPLSPFHLLEYQMDVRWACIEFGLIPVVTILPQAPSVPSASSAPSAPCQQWNSCRKWKSCRKCTPCQQCQQSQQRQQCQHCQQFIEQCYLNLWWYFLGQGGTILRTSYRNNLATVQEQINDSWVAN